MPDSVNLTRLRGEYFVFLHVFWGYSELLGSSWSFWICLVWFGRVGPRQCSVQADCLSAEVSVPEHSAWCPMNYESAQSARGQTYCSPCAPWAFLRWLSSMHAPTGALLNPQERGPSLCSASSLIFCLWTDCFCLSGHQLCFPHSGSAWLCPQFPLHVNLRQEAGGNDRTQCCFLRLPHSSVGKQLGCIPVPLYQITVLHLRNACDLKTIQAFCTQF